MRLILSLAGIFWIQTSAARADSRVDLCMQQCIVDYVVCNKEADDAEAQKLCDYYFTTCEEKCRAIPPVNPQSGLPLDQKEFNPK